MHNPKVINLPLEYKMQTIETILSLGRALRLENKLKIRQPLIELTIVSQEQNILNLVKANQHVLMDELNVKHIKTDTLEYHYITYKAKCNFARIGKRYGAKVQEVNTLLGSLSQEDIYRFLKEKKITINLHGKNILLEDKDILLYRYPKKGIHMLNQGAITCLLNIHLTPELIHEGYAREFINRIQKMRKQQNLNYTDKIYIRWYSKEALQTWLKEHQKYIMKETLCTTLQSVPLEEQMIKENLNGQEIFYSIAKDIS